MGKHSADEGTPKMPKKTSPKDTFAPDIGTRILGPFRRIGASGATTGETVIATLDRNGERAYVALSLRDLVMGRLNELAAFVVEHEIREYFGARQLKALASQLLTDLFTSDIYLAETEGVHAFDYGGARVLFYLLSGKLYGFTAKPPGLRVAAVRGRSSFAPGQGTPEQWAEHVGAPLIANPIGLMCFCAALAAMLHRVLDLQLPVVFVVGKSSLGKNVLFRLLESMFGRPEEPASPVGTEKGIRNKLRSFSDRSFLLQEATQIRSALWFVALIFDLVNHARDFSSSSDHSLRESKEFAVGLIVSSENSASEMFAGAARAPNPGMRARMIELFVPTEGVFTHDETGTVAERAQHTDELKANSEQFYGTFAHAFLSAVSNDHEAVRRYCAKKLPKLQAALCEGLGVNDAVTLRLVKSLAGWALMGCLANWLSVLPIAEDEVIATFRGVIQEYVTRMRKADSTERAVIAAVRAAIETNPGKFVELSQRQSGTGTALYGYRRSRDGVVQYLFFPSTFESLFFKVFGKQVVLDVLLTSGYLLKDKAGMQKQVRFDRSGGAADDDDDKERDRYYAISARIFDPD